MHRGAAQPGGLEADSCRSANAPIADKRLGAIHSSIDDVFFIAFAETVIGYVDEKYGRAAAWLALGRNTSNSGGSDHRVDMVDCKVVADVRLTTRSRISGRRR